MIRLRRKLIRVSRSLHLVRTAAETIGAGAYLARYLIATLTTPASATMHFALRLAVYLVAQVKKYAQDCGGESQIMGIEKDGRITQLWQSTVSQHEKTASVVMERAMPFLLYTTDPYWISPDKINEAVDFAALQIKKQLAEALPQLPATPDQPTQGDLPPDVPSEKTATPSEPKAETEEQPARRVRPDSTRARRFLPPSRE